MQSTVTLKTGTEPWSFTRFSADAVAPRPRTEREGTWQRVQSGVHCTKGLARDCAGARGPTTCMQQQRIVDTLQAPQLGLLLDLRVEVVLPILRLL